MLILKFILACYSIIAPVFALGTTPVFLIDDGALSGYVEPQQKPFSITDRHEFIEIVDHIVKLSNAIIFFIEEEFCLEDITTKDEIGTAYPYLRMQFLENNVKILLRVVDPYNYLRNRFEAYDFNTFHLSSTASRLRLEDNYKFMYVFFDDLANETRIQKLRRHDAVMRQVYFAVKQLSKGPVVAVYTGKRNPVILERPESEFAPRGKLVQGDPPYEPILIEFECRASAVPRDRGATFQFYDAKVINGKAVGLLPSKCYYFVLPDGSFVYDLIFNTTEEIFEKAYWLRFKFRPADKIVVSKGWKLTEISYGQDDLASTQLSDINSDWTNWFRSVGPLTLTPRKGSKTHSKLFAGFYTILINPVKPITVTTKPTTTTTTKITTTGPPLIGIPNAMLPVKKINKYRFRSRSKFPEVLVSVTIAMGLIVVIALLLILAWGIQMMMSIHTNSNYDDPNTTKPLFNADAVSD